MPIEIAKAGIDWYFATTENRHIRFYGPGEPTYEFELMKDIINYARSVGGSAVTAEIQTNGIFGEEEREWCLDNFNIMWMSFDGLPEVQNKYRPLNKKYSEMYGFRTSAEILEDNVQWMNKNKGDRKIMIGARVTMTEDNICSQKEMIDYFHRLETHLVA